MTPSAEQLTALDVAFLANERGGAHLHVGAILICTGAPPDQAVLTEHIASRLARVPRYRQRLVSPPLGLGRAAWVDDPDFDLGYHVRRTALPAPGGIAELRRLAERIFSQRLDRTKPLWELWVVEGLASDRFALINKTHHAMVDGVSGMDVTTALFDLEPSATPGRVKEPWSAAPPPSRTEMVLRAAGEAAVGPRELVGGALSALTRPAASAHRLRTGIAGLVEVAGAMFQGHASTAINGAPSSHRRIAWRTRELEDFKAAKNMHGGTINDVFLASVAGGLRSWLSARGEAVDRITLRAMIPVSVRTDAEKGALGNKIAGVSMTLPLHIADPVERLHDVTAQLRRLKEGNMAVGAQLVAGLQELAPPTILAQASRLQFSSRLYNILVSNVPGPQFPVYVLGAKLVEFVPIAFLGPDKRLAIVAASYDGRMCTSVLGDRELTDDVEALVGAIDSCLIELRKEPDGD